MGITKPDSSTADASPSSMRSPIPDSLVPNPPSPTPYSLPPISLTVTAIKQFVYCPRIIYFTYCLPLKRPTTYKMQEGKLEHESNEERESRRSLRAYGLSEGERHFAVRLTSERLALTGVLDMVIVTPQELIPVEFKSSTGSLGLNHKYQLTAYAMLVEDWKDKAVRRGFVYFIPQKRAVEVAVTPNMRAFVKKALGDIRGMIAKEMIPEGTRHAGRCVDCEFKNYCNDRE